MRAERVGVMPDKYQEEIEEILKGLGESSHPGNNQGAAKPPDDAPVASPPAPPEGPTAKGRGFWPLVSPGKLAIIGILLLVVGAFWFRPAIWLGLGLLVGAYLLFFVRPRPIRMEKRWRGQSMEQRTTAWDKFKKWLKN